MTHCLEIKWVLNPDGTHRRGHILSQQHLRGRHGLTQDQIRGHRTKLKTSEGAKVKHVGKVRHAAGATFRCSFCPTDFATAAERNAHTGEAHKVRRRNRWNEDYSWNTFYWANYHVLSPTLFDTYFGSASHDFWCIDWHLHYLYMYFKLVGVL